MTDQTSRVPTPGDLARRRPPKPTAPTVPAAAPARPEPAVQHDRPTDTPPAAPPARVRLTPEQAIAPGELAKKEHFRKYFLFGMRASGMHPHARLVGHDLMWRASHATGRLSPNLQPSTEVLALATGLTTGQVRVALQVLRTRGWLYYRPLQSGPRTGRQVMHLAIPAGELARIRARDRRHPDRLIS